MNQLELNQLTKLFRKLGARDPEGCARFQMERGSPQLARYLFLRQAWKSIVREDDRIWIDANIAASETKPDQPYAGVGIALKRLRASGATNQDILDVVRGAQAEILFQLCYLLDDPGEVEPEVQHIFWGLFQVDSEGNPLARIEAVSETMLDMDPTGREMRPREQPNA